MSSGIGVLLLTSVAGYWVLERASKHKGRLRRIGQILGAFIIIVSIAGSVCGVVGMSSGKYGCGYHGKAGKLGFCPYSQKSFKSPVPDSN